MDTLIGIAVVVALLLVLGLPPGVWFARELGIDRELRRHAEQEAASRPAPPPPRNGQRPAVHTGDTVRHGHHHSPSTS